SYRIFARMQEGYDTLGLTPDRLFLVLQHLVAPWGPGLYFLVLYGWLALNPRARLQLAIYYVLPLVLVWVSGVLGPPRAYIYWVPFILIPAAHGGVRA
ncbi:MAG: hypothetical protein GWM98_18995, partial [Nitrospinaceae bacterium]|nr:hypothetical protein [Nitrospinaceae bacterium]NIR56186.1 hypothetical protein [Nitrospinaceae bacterium]NIS86642.1 hypothetical protein [Nitrospinaceae bacterium]NIT83475.1 hypothetical protein [Nitrospinaceae bacterium]NIU45680.1 hypothetical protein [Nitrospinaceae bacterium]